MKCTDLVAELRAELRVHQNCVISTPSPSLTPTTLATSNGTTSVPISTTTASAQKVFGGMPPSPMPPTSHTIAMLRPHHYAGVPPPAPTTTSGIPTSRTPATAWTLITDLITVDLPVKNDTQLLVPAAEKVFDGMPRKTKQPECKTSLVKWASRVRVGYRHVRWSIKRRYGGVVHKINDVLTHVGDSSLFLELDGG